MIKLPDSTLTRGLSRWTHRWLRSSILVATGAASLSVVSAQAETLLQYSLYGQPGSQTKTLATTVADGLFAGDITRGASLEPYSLPRGMSQRGYSTVSEGVDPRQQAIDRDEYIELSFTVAPGYIVSLEGLVHSLRRSAYNGPMYYEWKYSFDGFETAGETIVPQGWIWDALEWTEDYFYYRGRNSGSGGVPNFYNYMVGDVSDQGDGNEVPNFELSGISDLQNIPGGTQVTFRLYASGNEKTTQTNTVAFGVEKSDQIGGPQFSGSIMVDPNLEGVPLLIISDFGGTDPVPGLHYFPAGTAITATATQLTDGSGEVRSTVSGWSGMGSVADGDGDSATFTLNEPTTLEWNWWTENRLSVEVEGSGSVDVLTRNRRILLGWNFAGYIFPSENTTLYPGDQTNIDGVPTSTVAPEMEPSTVRRTPVYDEEAGLGLRPVQLTHGGLSTSMYENTPNLLMAIEKDKYFEFKVSPKPGETVSLDSLYFNYRYTGSAPHSIALLYSLDEFATYEIIESVRIQDQNSGTQDIVSRTIPFPIEPDLQNVTGEMTFRLYGWGATGGGTLALRNTLGVGFDDMVLYGGSSQVTTVATTDEVWVEEGASFNVESTPAVGSIFTGWSGDFFGKVAELRNMTLSESKTITANFATDSNESGIPDDWKLLHFETLDVDPSGDPDVDGFTNYEEYLRGTDPNYAEELLAVGAVPFSIWENAQRDPKNPGHFITGYYSPEFRGAWDRSNHYRNADDLFHPEGLPVAMVDSVSFDGPRMIIREDSWEEEWDDATVETVFSVGDDDGSTFFIRYQDELNWYRVTVAGQVTNAPTRPAAQVSIQSRINGVYSGLVAKEGPASDPTNDTGYKRLRVRFTPRMEGGQSKIDIAVSGWNEPDQGWETASFGHREWTIDDELGWGRAGFGTFAQASFTQDEVAWNPVTAGTMFESFIISRNDEVLLDVDWDLSPRPGDFPEGWENPFASDDDLEGDWRVSAHGTITERSTDGGATSGSPQKPAADAEAPMFLLDSIGTSSYVLDLGIHPFELGANGFIYDYIDSDNYSRVFFASTGSGLSHSIPSGLTVSRKQNGVWSNIILGDTGFIYRPAQPFTVSFARAGQTFVISVEEVDVPGKVYRWEWSDSTAPALGGRYGFTSWQSGNAHFLSLESYGAVVQSADGIAIIGIEKVGETIVLTVDNPSGDPYKVERTVDLASGEWETVDTEQTETSWSGPIPSGADKAFWRLNR